MARLLHKKWTLFFELEMKGSFYNFSDRYGQGYCKRRFGVGGLQCKCTTFR